MKTRRTVKTKKTAKTRKTRKPMLTNARYVYWYAVAHPRFGQRLLKTTSDSLPAMLEEHDFALSSPQMAILTEYLGDTAIYGLSGGLLLQGVCHLKSRMPGKKPPLESTDTLALAAGTETPVQPQMTTRSTIPPPPPPPWG